MGGQGRSEAPDALDALDEDAVARLVAGVEVDPSSVQELAVGLGAEDGGPRRRSVASQLLGAVAVVRGDPESARQHHGDAVAAARELGDPARLAACLASLAPALLYLGRVPEALEVLDEAGAAATGVAAHRVDVQRAAVLDIVGRGDEAEAAYARGIPALAAAGDRVWEGRARTNRANLWVQRGRIADAREDLARARALAEADGHTAAAAQIEHNAGWFAALDGDVVAALAAFDRADTVLAAGGPDATATGRLDRAATLLAAGLTVEAVLVARAVAAQLEATGRAVEAARAHLVVGRAALGTGALGLARSAAAAAAAGFTGQGRDVHAALAVVLRAEVAAAAPLPPEDPRPDAAAALADLRRDLVAALEVLVAAGWPDAVESGRAVAVRLAVRAGDVAGATQLAQSLDGGRSVLGRVAAAHARATVAEAIGEDERALAEVGSGLAALDTHRATLGATDLRSGAAALGRDLADLGLDVVVGRGTPSAVLHWAEATRAATLRHAPVRPTDDAELRGLLAQLRDTVTTLDHAIAAGADAAPLVARQAELEDQVAALQRRTPGTGAAASTTSVDALVRALADHRLVEFVVVRDVVRAVDVVDGAVSLRAVGPVADLEGVLAGLGFGLQRLAWGHGSPRSLDAARASTLDAAATLDAMLFGPSAGRRGEPTVIVPSRELHRVPWGILPSLRGVPVSVAPSAHLWARARTAPARRGVGRVGVVAGPDLDHADEEAAAVAARHGVVAVGSDHATSARVLALLEDVDLAHVACHGHWRGDNPLFSALRLTDGPLTVHDLQTLRTPPRTIVLSSCESGLSEVRPGDELLGLTASLLGLGVGAVVASTIPVADAATLRLMTDLHARLAAGAGPAAALAAASDAALDDPDHRLLAAAASFTVLGAG